MTTSEAKPMRCCITQPPQTVPSGLTLNSNMWAYTVCLWYSFFTCPVSLIFIYCRLTAFRVTFGIYITFLRKNRCLILCLFGL